MQASGGLSRLAALFLLLCLSQYCHGVALSQEPTYLIVAPTSIRPNQEVTIAATVLKMEFDSFTVTGLVRKLEGSSYVEICGATYTFARAGSYDIKMRTRDQMAPGNYTLRVAGYSDPQQQGLIFQNDTELFFFNKQVSVFIQTSKPFYKQGQTVRFRIIPIQTNMMPVSTTMDVKIRDPTGYVVREYYAQHTNAGGIVSLSYPLTSNLLPFGNWTIEVLCQYETYNSSFIVEEFYPPLFYVNVSMPTYMLRNSFGLSGLVASNHTTGRGTKGNATIQLDILTVGSTSVKPIEPIIRTIPYFDSRTDFLFTREEMEQRAGGPTSLIGKELKITATVQDWFYNTTSGGFQSAIVYDEDVDLQFLGGEVRTFKPDMPFKISIAAVKQDGTPLDPFNENRTINLVIEETVSGANSDPTLGSSQIDTVEISRETSIAEYWLYPKFNTKRFVVTARYREKRDTERTLVATRFWSPNENYLQISTPTQHPKVGEYMTFNLKTNTYVDRVFYHIVAAGEIVVSDNLLMYARSKHFSVALSREMSPSSKIIAYFIANDGQVIADSLNFFVNSSMLHEMTVKFNRGKELGYDTVEITATADPLSYVAFAAIEYQLYSLGARNDLTWEMVYHEQYSYDGYSNTSVHQHWLKEGQVENSAFVPTPTFAHDANTTFYYAGLYVFTDANASAVFTHCNKSKGELPCMDGLSCYDYKQLCSWKPECSFDHRDEMGCPNATNYNVKLYNQDSLWRTKHIGMYYQDGAFMWLDQFTKPNGRIDIRVNIPTFPTTWVVSAFAMSREHGLAILPVPARFDGVRPMFATVQGPPSAKIGEHITLRVSIFNYWDESLDVLLTIEKSDDYDFVALNFNTQSTDPSNPVSGGHQILVPVFPGDNRQINIPVVPRKFGHLAIRVNAFSFVAGHTVTHHVYVQHYGVREHYITNYQVDLSVANAETLPDLKLPVEELDTNPEQRIQNYVPGSPRSKVYVIGDIVGISFFPYTHYDLSALNLLEQPYSSGAETAFNFAVNLYTLKTLRLLSKFSTAKISKVVNSLNSDLQELMLYMIDDGSYVEFRWSKISSTWLTATVLRILAQSREGVSDLYLDFQVPPSTITKAALWLAKQQDPVSGAFLEKSTIYNRRYDSVFTVPVNGVDRPSNVSLTALCVLALSEASSLVTDKSISDAMVNAVTYLNSHVSKLTDPFETAIVTYALMLTDTSSGQKEVAWSKLVAMKKKEAGMAYWSTHNIPPIPKGTNTLDNNIVLLSKQYSNVTSYAVAATGYALLAYLQNNAPEQDLNDIQKFLQEQHMWVGGFSSTQDTLVAMQGLKILAERNQERVTYSMSFIFTSDQDTAWSKAITIDQENWFELQEIDLPSHWGHIKVQATGHGVALVQLETFKNHERREQLRMPTQPVFDFGDKFNKDINTSGFNHSWVHYNICPRWTGPSNHSGMAVLEIGIPSGYVVHNNTLKAVVQNARDNTASTLRNAEFIGDKVVFYFDYLDRTNDVNCAKFSAFRWYPVANISEHTFMRVYEYYEPGNFNHTFYEKVEFRTLTVCLVCGSYQCPFCPHYAAGTTGSPNLLLVLISVSVAIFSYFDFTLLRVFGGKWLFASHPPK